MPAYSPLFGVLTIRKTTTSGLPKNYFRLGRRTRKIRKLLDATIGAAAGGAALLAVKRITASTTEQGGFHRAATVNELNRNTTAGDVTALKNFFSEDSKITTPANKAGSGIPSKITNWPA